MVTIKIILLLFLLKDMSAVNVKKCGIDAEISKDNECVCPKGFIGNPNEECIKIPDDICKKNPCGPNSECIDDKNDSRVISHGPYCLCESNTFGLPPNCQVRCKDDDECKADEFCANESGKCEIGCRQDHSACKSDEYCEVSTNQCKKGCRLNHENCQANEICNMDSLKCVIGCRNDDACKAGEFCELSDGKCVSGCRTDDNCADNEYCDFHTSTCLKGCNLDENCGFDQYCNFTSRECLKGCRSSDENCNSDEYCDDASKICKSGCNNDNQCDSNEYCHESHKCKKLCSKSKCGPNSHCTTKNHEFFCSCKEGFIQRTKVGCQPRFANETTAEFESHKNRFSFCSKFCAEGASCGYTNKKLFCTCSNDRVSNPFLNCKPQFHLSFAPPGVFCDCCTAKQKPGCEVPIDANLLKSLVG